MKANEEDISALCAVGSTSQATTQMQISLFSYWKVIHKRVSDQVPIILRYGGGGVPEWR